jgi:hypothetical protein
MRESHLHKHFRVDLVFSGTETKINSAVCLASSPRARSHRLNPSFSILRRPALALPPAPPTLAHQRTTSRDLAHTTPSHGLTLSLLPVLGSRTFLTSFVRAVTLPPTVPLLTTKDLGTLGALGSAAASVGLTLCGSAVSSGLGEGTVGVWAYVGARFSALRSFARHFIARERARGSSLAEKRL